jgi:hypothetical protein
MTLNLLSTDCEALSSGRKNRRREGGNVTRNRAGQGCGFCSTGMAGQRQDPMKSGQSRGEDYTAIDDLIKSQ